MLLHIPRILDAAQVAEIRQRLDASDWTDGRETVGPQGAQVKRNHQLADASPLKAELGQIIEDRIKDVLDGPGIRNIERGECVYPQVVAVVLAAKAKRGQSG